MAITKQVQQMNNEVLIEAEQTAREELAAAIKSGDQYEIDLANYELNRVLAARAENDSAT